MVRSPVASTQEGCQSSSLELWAALDRKRGLRFRGLGGLGLGFRVLGLRV